MDLINADCFEGFKKIKDKTVDLFLLDLPYGQTSCKWDSLIDLDKMWVEIKRTMKKEGIIVFFCTAKFGYSLIKSNPKWFRYDLVWEKSRKVGFLSANKMPLRKHELMYVFKEKQGIYNPQKTEGKPYTATRKSAGVYGEDVESKTTINNGDRHPTSIIEIEEVSDFEVIGESSEEEDHGTVYIFKEKQGIYNPQKTEGKPYKTKEVELTNSYYRDGEKKYKSKANENKGDRHPTSVIGKFEETPLPSEHVNLYVFKDKQGTYNPQKTTGHKSRDRSENKRRVVDGVYGSVDRSKGNNTTEERHPTSIIRPEDDPTHETLYVFKDKQGTYNPQKTTGHKEYTHGKRPEKSEIYNCKHNETSENKTERHPSTILKFNNPAKSVHRTQKPVDLCEWLIKSYSNENDLVVDFCMGSGTVGVACKNTKRKFVGVERDPDIYKIACDRIKEN